MPNIVRPDVQVSGLTTLPTVAVHDRMDLAAAIAQHAVAITDPDANAYTRAAAGQAVWAIVRSLNARAGSEAGLYARRDALAACAPMSTGWRWR